MSVSSPKPTIVRGPRRATSWLAPRKFALAFNVGALACVVAIVARGHGSWPVLVLALVAGVNAIDTWLGFPLWFAIVDAPRYLRWTVWCRRGRRCANLHVCFEQRLTALQEQQVTVHLQWRCEACGTEYESVEQVPERAIRVVNGAGTPLS